MYWSRQALVIAISLMLFLPVWALADEPFRNKIVPRITGNTAAAAETGAAVADNRPHRWRYRWENNHWWYWTPQNRWMLYNDQNRWVYPEATDGRTKGCGGATVAPQAVVPGSARYVGPGRSYNPRLGAFGYSPSDL